MNNFRSLILLVLCLLTLWAPGALASLSGEAEWGYTHYQLKRDGVDNVTASSFSQRYSFLYEKKGLLSAGRLGAYDLGVGAEWAAFDTDIDGNGIDKDSYKALYNGRLVIAPGALPFRLYVYNRDLRPMSFDRTLNRSISDVVSPDLVIGLNNGQTINSGLQLVAGVQNSSYLGPYREIIGKWPRLLIDYEDTYRRDINKPKPENNRFRNMAFISLNKKDNWFHYRVKKYNDYVNSINDTNETTLMLGTVDHVLKRQWISLTNWIRISTDGSYNELEKVGHEPKDWYNINFFTVMSRQRFKASSFINMQRIKDGNSLEKVLDIPLYLTNKINPESTLRTTAIVWHNSQENELNQTNVNLLSDKTREGVYYGRMRLDTNQRSQIQFSPFLELEVHTGDLGAGEGVRSGVEIYNKDLANQPLSWQANSRLARFSGEGSGGQTGTLWEGVLEGNVYYRAARNIKLEGSQKVLYATGDSSYGETRNMSPEAAVSFNQNLNGAVAEDVDGRKMSSETSLGLEHISASRIRNHLLLLYRYEKNNNEKLSNFEITHRLDYSARHWRLRMKNSYSMGDDAGRNNFSGARGSEVGPALTLPTSDQNFEHESTVEYSPNNAWRSKLKTNFLWSRDGSGRDGTQFAILQDLQRTFYRAGSRAASLATVNQWMEYIHSISGSRSLETINFSLAGNVNPLSSNFWNVGTGVVYRYHDYKDSDFEYFLSSSLNFTKFKVDFRYRYGAIENNKAVAHLYEVKVKKFF